MKITHESRDMLILEDRPWIVAVVLSVFILGFSAGALGAVSQGKILPALICLASAGLGGVMVFFLVRRVQVIFDRARGLIDIRRKSLAGMRRRTLPLAVLQQARVEVSHGTDNATYRVVLDLAPGHHDGPLPLTTYLSSDGAPKNHAAKAINRLIGLPPSADRVDSRAPGP